ncbi:Hypothetical predicted protein, partial [Marmota monax]
HPGSNPGPQVLYRCANPRPLVLPTMPFIIHWKAQTFPEPVGPRNRRQMPQ